MLRRLRPWRRRWRTFADLFPLTQGGVLMFAALGLVFWYVAFQKSDMVLLVATLAILIVALLVVLSVVEAAFATSRRWKEQPPGASLQLVAGSRGWTGWTFRPPWRPFIEVSWSWLEPSDVVTETQKGPEGLIEMVVPARRCLADRVVRKLEVRDVLGVAAIRWKSVQVAQVLVLPAEQTLNESTLVQSLYGGDDISDPFGDPQGDRVDMRRYSAGDPPRLILWKVYARSRKLMVRVPERALVPTPRTCAYLVAGPGDELCASLMRSVLEGDFLGQGWRFGADGSSDYATKEGEALQILARSGNPESQDECRLSAFLEAARRDGYQSCLVVIPPGAGSWVEAVTHAIPRTALSLTLLSVEARSKELPPVPGWHRYIYYAEPGAVPEPTAVMERLHGRNVTRLLFDPHTKRVLPYRKAAPRPAGGGR